MRDYETTWKRIGNIIERHRQSKNLPPGSLLLSYVSISMALAMVPPQYREGFERLIARSHRQNLGCGANLDIKKERKVKHISMQLVTD